MRLVLSALSLPLALVVLGPSVRADSPSATVRAEEEETKKLRATSDAITYSVKTTAPDNPIETGGAMILVNAPIEKVRKIVQDFGHYKQLVPTFDQSRLLSRSKTSSQVYLSVPILNGALTIWAIVNLAAPVKDGAGEKIVGAYEKGNLADFRATWRLRAVDAEHTVLKSELLVDPKLPLPASLITTQLKKSADKAVHAVKEKAEGQAATKPMIADPGEGTKGPALADKKPPAPTTQ